MACAMVKNNLQSEKKWKLVNGEEGGFGERSWDTLLKSAVCQGTESTGAWE